MSQITTFYQKYFALYFIETFSKYLDQRKRKKYFDLSYNKNIITFTLSIIKIIDKLLELNPLFEPSLAIDKYFILNLEDSQNNQQNKDQQKNKEKQKQNEAQINKQNKNIQHENENIQVIHKINENQQNQVEKQLQVEQIEKDKNEKKNQVEQQPKIEQIEKQKDENKQKQQNNNKYRSNKLKQKDVTPINQDQKINLALGDISKLVSQTAKYFRVFIVISLRFIYIYFYSKETSKQINVRKINRQKQIKNSISVIFNQLKDKHQEYQFNPNQYMIFIFKSMLKFEVNIKFLSTIRQIIQKCNIDQEQKIKLFNQLKAQQISIRLIQYDKFKDNQNIQQSIQKNDKANEKLLQQSIEQQIIIENNTPIKDQTHKFHFKQSQIKQPQLQTNDKSLILFNRNRQTSESNDFTLSLNDFTKIRTQRAKFQKPKFYTNNKRAISSSENLSSNSSVKNLNEINNQNNPLNGYVPHQYALIFNRSTRQFHSRLNQLDKDQYPFQQTPKPKKKLKLQKTCTQDFKYQQIAIKPLNLFSD